MSDDRLKNIDFLRGIAALLVVWQHTSEMFVRTPEIAANGTFLFDMAWAVDFGRIGVVCFFLISGFVIPFSFSTGKGAIKEFAIRRFFRLYPIYWVSIAASILVTFTFSGQFFEQGTVFANVTMLQKFFGEPHIQGLYWTLQIELIFYFLCACLFAVGKLDKPFNQAIACIISFFIFCTVEILRKKFSYFGDIDSELRYIPYVISVMFVGTMLRTILMHTISRQQKYLLLFVCSIVFSIPLLVGLLHFIGIEIGDSPARFSASHLIGLILFIIGFYSFKSVNKYWVWLGTISYSIYLFHPIAMKLVHWLVKNWFSSYHLSVYMIAVLLITIFISIFTYQLIEKPSIQLGRLLAKRNRGIEF